MKMTSQSTTFFPPRNKVKAKYNYMYNNRQNTGMHTPPSSFCIGDHSAWREAQGPASMYDTLSILYINDYYISKALVISLAW